MANLTALDSGNPDGDDVSKASKLAARAARFSSKLPGNRYKELEDMRARQRKAFEQEGLIKVGKTELGDAIDMRGTCETMCSEYEREFREYTREVHPFEAGPSKRIDPTKAVAAYSRSDAGAGHGDSAILPSDLRTPQTLMRTLDYLFSEVMPLEPPSASTSSPYSQARKALGYSAGFIRDRTRAIRKEFAMQSSWGHQEAINSFERIARWHILCLRELQEETGTNTDMHIDAAELGRCFTSLRQQYNDRREESGVDMPCPNEPEFRAYMLIFDLASKSVSIPTAELPSAIVDHPLVKLAWEIRRAAQRNFDSQKEGSKANAELGANLITRFVRLMKAQRVPFLMSCLVEIRLREIRRSALRALNRTYPRLRGEPVRLNEAGEVVERRMVLLRTLDRMLGCEQQEAEESAWDDVLPADRSSDAEAVDVVRKFELEVYSDQSGPVGALINAGAWFNDNRDAPYTRRWLSITAKKGDVSYVDIVNGNAGVQVLGTPMSSKTKPPSTAFDKRPISVPGAVGAPKIDLSFDTTPTVSTTPKRSPPRSAFDFSFAPAATAPSVVPPAGEKPVIAAATNNFPPVVMLPTHSSPPMPATPPLPAFSFTPPTPPVPVKPSQPAPLFSKPGIFQSTTQPSKPTKPHSSSPLATVAPILPSSPSPTPPPVAVTPVVSTHHSPPETPLIQPRRRLSPEERARRVATAPTLCYDLIREVVERLIDENRPILRSVIKQEAAATQYVAIKRQRLSKIEEWARGLFGMLYADNVKSIAKKALLGEIGRRGIIRNAIKHWRRWARRRRYAREDSERDHTEAFERLGRMGIGRGRTLVTVRNEVTDGHEDGFDATRPEVRDRQDEMEVDNALHQVESKKDRFYAASTFFHTIARYVASLLTPVHSPISASTSFSALQRAPHTHASPHFRILFSSCSKSGSPAPTEAGQWLLRKFKPHLDAEYEQEGVVFSTTTWDQDTQMSEEDKHVGLIVFEVPLKTSDHMQKQKNEDDAKRRIIHLVQLEGRPDLRYDLPILFVTWENEPLEDLKARIGLRTDTVDSTILFNPVGLLCLEFAEDLDTTFEKRLRNVIPRSPLRELITLTLGETLQAALPSWERFTSAVATVLAQHPADPRLALTCLSTGISTINDLLAEVWQLCIRSTIPFPNVLLLSSFEANESGKASMDMQSAVEAIENYIRVNLPGPDEFTLLMGPLRHAAQHGQPLPVVPFLQALFAFVLHGQDMLAPLSISRNDIFTDKDTLMGIFATQIDNKVTMSISRITPVPTRDDHLDELDDPFQNDSNDTHDAAKPADTYNYLTTGLKRPRKSLSTPDLATPPKKTSTRKKESTAKKNARLLRVLADVNRTLESTGMEVDTL